MSLSHREERLLHGVEEALWSSDLYLTPLLVAFTVLAAGNPMPDHEDLRQRTWQTFAAWLAVVTAIMRLAVQVTRASVQPGHLGSCRLVAFGKEGLCDARAGPGYARAGPG